MAFSDGISRRELLIGGIGVTAASQAAAQANPNIDDFFRNLTEDWIRHDPSLATRANYFTGDERDRLARQLTPRTLEWRLDRIARARKALAELRKFDRTRMTELQRVSAELLDWQLDLVISEEPYLDYDYPLQQMNGANVQLVEGLTVSYPVLTERNAENYLVVLVQAAASLDDATAEARRLAGK